MEENSLGVHKNSRRNHLHEYIAHDSHENAIEVIEAKKEQRLHQNASPFRTLICLNETITSTIHSSKKRSADTITKRAIARNVVFLRK
jgi:hypothetical protein